MSRVVQPSVFLLVFGRFSALSPVLCAVLVAILILFSATAVLPQVASDLATALHVDLDQPPPYLPGSRATGHVTNDSGYRLTNVRLRVDASDTAGQALPPTFGWVDGDVPAHGRAWFRILVPPNAVRLSVTVIDFNLVSIESP
jgi:hypothetical protein